MNKTILIVEDYDDVRQLMRLWVEMYGYSTVEASDGVQAVECFKRTHPDLILMDLGLPVMNGIIATRRIRELSEGTDVPVIAVTAYDSEFHKQALQAGCNQVISKPVNYEFVMEAISGYFRAQLRTTS